MNPNQSEELRAVLDIMLKPYKDLRCVKCGQKSFEVLFDEVVDRLLQLFQDRLKRLEIEARIAELERTRTSLKLDANLLENRVGGYITDRLAQLNQSLEEEKL